MHKVLSAQVLLFMEDPGAVNFLADLPGELNVRGITSSVVADGLARAHLEKRNIPFACIDKSWDVYELINSIQPSLVILGTSDNKNSFAFKLIEVCRAKQIKTVGAVDMAANAQYRFKGHSGNALEFEPDYLAVPDLVTKKAFESLGFSAQKIFESGHPHYDYVIANAEKLKISKSKKDVQKSLFPNLDPQKLLVSFLCQPVSTLVDKMMERNSEYTLTGWNDSNRRTDIVLEELIDALSPFRNKISFGVRLHPKNSLSEFAPYEKYLDFVDSETDSLEFVYASDILLGMSTMLLFEAALMGKLALSILPRKSERDWLPAMATQILPVVWTRQDLKNSIEQIFVRHVFEGPSPAELGIMPGALNRLADFICKFI